MKTKEFKDLISNETSKVHELMAFRKANKAWLKKSMLIAIAVLKVLREQKISQVELAEAMKVTPQYVNKILKGNENLTLETITKLEGILKINLISIESYHYKVDAVLPIGLPRMLNRNDYKQLTKATKTEERKSFNAETDNKNNFATAA